MSKTAFEVIQNNVKDNQRDWLKNMLYIEYGRIVKIVDSTTVRVQLLVQTSKEPRTFLVRLLEIGSSLLVEESVQPSLNDTVLLLFLRSSHPSMFNSPQDRKERDEEETLYIERQDGYNSFSGVGILAQTARNRAPTVRHYGIDAEGPYMTEKTSARLMKAFKAAVSAVFDVPANQDGTAGPDAPVVVAFGESSPLEITSERGADLSFEGQVNVSSKAGVLIEVAEDELTSTPPVSIAISDSGLIVDSGDRDISITGSEIHLNGDTKSLVTYAALNTALSTFLSQLTIALTKTPILGNGVLQPTWTGLPTSIDISAAEATTVKTG